MTRQVIVGVGLAGTGVAVALALRPKTLALFSKACERMLDQMPDDFPIFARCYERLSRLVERQVGEHREELLAGLSGRVVEIGAGNGFNFPHYPSAVEEVVALEPEGYLREQAEQAAHNAPVPVSVGDAAAYPLPLAAASVDAAVASLVLCTVPDPPSALAELRRVLKPGAELRFMEHVRSDRPRKAQLQERLDGWGIWPRLGGGCHCARNTSLQSRRLGSASSVSGASTSVRPGASPTRMCLVPRAPSGQEHGAGGVAARHHLAVTDAAAR